MALERDIILAWLRSDDPDNPIGGDPYVARAIADAIEANVHVEWAAAAADRAIREGTARTVALDMEGRLESAFCSDTNFNSDWSLVPPTPSLSTPVIDLIKLLGTLDGRAVRIRIEVLDTRPGDE